MTFLEKKVPKDILSWSETVQTVYMTLYACLMQGSFTGPRLNWSGSSLRTEATGYGLVTNILFYSVWALMLVGI